MRRLFDSLGLFLALVACLAVGYSLGFKSGIAHAREQASFGASRVAIHPLRGS